MAKITLQTGPGVFETLASVCHSHREAAKQFVENSADAIQQLGTDEGRISIRLQYETANAEPPARTLKSIIVTDNGIGMSQEKMKQVLQHIGDSEKVQLALRGEKGIGILAFSLIAEELHIASTDIDGAPSSCLVLERPWLKRGRAEIREKCSRHEHSERGTAVYLENILPEAMDKLRKDGFKEFLGKEFASDLRQGLYAMSISDNQHSEPVPPQRYRGIKAMSATHALGRLGSVSIELHVLPWEMADATLSLYGRGGTRICLLTDLDDFKIPPWTDRRIEGYVRCDQLKRTASKTSVVQDQIYQAFVSELNRIAPDVRETIDRVSADSRERRFEVVMHKAGKLIDKFLRYREKGLLEDLPYRSLITMPQQKKEPVIVNTDSFKASSERPARPRRPVETRAPHIRLTAPPQERSSSRSWYDPQSSSIYINREHQEFMLAQKEDTRCVRYLFSIWVKESLLQEYGSDAERLADEMVGMLAEAEPLLW
ncbi:MAG: ATP-binding protein [Dehalococcoidia bacterium]|nr:ATP-binding protein [Dehalococcoidia bacterium]